MSKKLQNFLAEGKKNKQEAKQKQRDEHLISLGLTDDSKPQKTYINYYTDNAKSDENGNYIVSYGAIDVTDEEYAEICELYPQFKEPSDEQIIKRIGENISTIKKIAVFFTVLWVVGVLVSLIIIIAS